MVSNENIFFALHLNNTINCIDSPNNPAKYLLLVAFFSWGFRFIWLQPVFLGIPPVGFPDSKGHTYYAMEKKVPGSVWWVRNCYLYLF